MERILVNPTQTNAIRSGHFAMEIFMDASLTGWGAICCETRTHGFWSTEEKQNHIINFLKLLRVFHALRRSQRRGCDILLRVDNSTALSYIKRMGSIKFPIEHEGSLGMVCGMRPFYLCRIHPFSSKRWDRCWISGDRREPNRIGLKSNFVFWQNWVSFWPIRHWFICLCNQC